MDDFKELEKQLERFNSDYLQDVGRAKQLAESGKELTRKVSEGEELDVTYRKVGGLFRSMSEERQSALKVRIEKLLSLGLRAVFEEDFTFRINMVQKADQVTANFTVTDARDLETDILNARGGGLAAVAGVLLQLIMLTFLKDRARRILFLDESFAHLSDEYTRRMGILLKMLSGKLGVQIVMVTHQPEFMEYADTAYKFTAPKGVTKAERLV